MKYLILALALVSYTALDGCGVRGDPEPPLTGAEIGHGQPSFKRAGTESDFSSVPSPTEPTPTPKPTAE